ncbi:MAG: hypothetical protein LBD52_06415 [Prevotellaceae bacterium]|nr:hypothetical protein [Prevotellaceae bacterium]
MQEISPRMPSGMRTNSQRSHPYRMSFAGVGMPFLPGVYPSRDAYRDEGQVR